MDGQRTKACGMLCFAKTFLMLQVVWVKIGEYYLYMRGGFAQGSKELTDSLLRFGVSFLSVSKHTFMYFVKRVIYSIFRGLTKKCELYCF